MDFLKNYFVVLLALILVFVLNLSFTLGETILTPTYDFGNYKILDVKEGKLVLECNKSEPLSSSQSIRWSKDGEELKTHSSEGKQIEIKADKLIIKRPNWDDVGNYTCSIHPPSKPEVKAEIYVIAKPYVKITPSQMLVIEGEELKIECTIYGKHAPTIVWKFDNNATYDKSNDRVKITTAGTDDDNILKSYFEIEKADKNDRGEYTCIAQNVTNSQDDTSTSKATCFVRIKDKYAALWPFIGICVEVVVLCAIIFIYEKKRNKAELEESDTDQSPEQKNTPDHGKDSVRQRK